MVTALAGHSFSPSSLDRVNADQAIFGTLHPQLPSQALFSLIRHSHNLVEVKLWQHNTASILSHHCHSLNGLFRKKKNCSYSHQLQIITSSYSICFDFIIRKQKKSATTKEPISHLGSIIRKQRSLDNLLQFHHVLLCLAS